MSSSVRRLFADRDIPPRRRRHHPLRVRVRLTLLRLRFSTTARITSPGSCTTTSTPGAPPPPHSRRRSLSFIAPCPQSTWCVRSPRSTCPHASFSEAVEWTPLFQARARAPLDSTRSRPRFRPPNPLHPDRTHADARTSFSFRMATAATPDRSATVEAGSTAAGSPSRSSLRMTADSAACAPISRIPSPIPRPAATSTTCTDRTTVSARPTARATAETIPCRARFRISA